MTGPVVIVRVAPPFDEAMWAAAERFAERIAAGEAGLPGNDEVARLTRERAAMRGYFAALLIRLTRAEVERDEARAERDAAVAVALDATSGPRATHEDFMVTLGSERGARDEARRDLYRVADALGMTLDAEGQGSVAAPTDELVEAVREVTSERDDLLDEVGQYRGIVEDVASRPCEVEGCGITTAACLPCRARHWLERG